MTTKPKQSKAAFIRHQAPSLSAAEIVARGRSAGHTFDVAYVYSVRASAKAAKAVETKRLQGGGTDRMRRTKAARKREKQAPGADAIDRGKDAIEKARDEDALRGAAARLDADPRKAIDAAVELLLSDRHLLVAYKIGV